jgi:hypothetical protein
MIRVAYRFRKYVGGGALMLTLIASMGLSLSTAAPNHGPVMYATDGTPVARYHLETAWPSKLEIR